MKIAICDDEPIQLDILEKTINGCSVWRGKQIDVSRFACGEELIESVNAGQEYDFVFLDVEMEGLTGLEVYSCLSDGDSVIIFVSAHSKYLPNAFELRSPGYLIKQYDQDIFDKTILSALKQQSEADVFIYNFNGKERKIPCKRIYMFKIVEHCLIIETDSGNQFIYGITLAEIEKQIVPYGFFRCSKNYLVNMHHCIDRRGNKVRFGSDSIKDEVLISRRKLADFDNQLMKCKWGR